MPDVPLEVVVIISQFLSRELDSYEFMPLIMDLRKKIGKPAKIAL